MEKILGPEFRIGISTTIFIGKKKFSSIVVFIGKRENILKMKLGVLSGGELQRILIAFAVMGNPNVLLFDEPTADIDVAGQESIYKMIHDLKKKGITVILVSHDLNIVYRYAEKVLCLNRKNICFGKPKEILNTEHLQKLYGEHKAFYQHEH